MHAETFYGIFLSCIRLYHIEDNVDKLPVNCYPHDTINYFLFEKCSIDNVQWHLEDIIRDPHISPQNALLIKRRIDRLNQQRTDTVEKIDDFYYNRYKQVVCKKGAKHSTESIGWAIDRLSILALKIYHTDIEILREDASAGHIIKSKERAQVLRTQCRDLILSINWLIEEIACGEKIVKVYRQMKMYNDIDFNPVLYRNSGAAQAGI